VEVRENMNMFGEESDGRMGGGGESNRLSIQLVKLGPPICHCAIFEIREIHMATQNSNMR